MLAFGTLTPRLHSGGIGGALEGYNGGTRVVSWDIGVLSNDLRDIVTWVTTSETLSRGSRPQRHCHDLRDIVTWVTGTLIHLISL